MTLIGLEVHATLNQVKTKLFCSCALPPAQAQPNTYTCPVCLGHPGSKPVLNKKAFELALKLALALKCHIAPQLIFSRKTYFYPDLVKNYQITQYEQPLGSDGFIELDSGKKVRIQRIHMEEDPGALIHPAGMHDSGYVLIDYNRSGMPLCEIVTFPDMESPDEAREFMNKLQTILEYVGAADADATIKADGNVSIVNGERIEIKNITGFKEIERAITYEIHRQESLDTPPKLKETRGWDSVKGITIFQRSKEGEADYGYIIDPDLVPIDINPHEVLKVKHALPELPDVLVKKWVSEGVDRGDAVIIANNVQLAQMFSEVSAKVDKVLTAKWIRRELSRVLNFVKKDLSDTQITPQHMIDLLTLVSKKEITDANAQKLLEDLVKEPFDVKEKVKSLGLKVIADSSQLEKFCKEAIQESPKAVEDFKAGKLESLNYVVGIVMRKTKGQAKPDVVRELLLKLL